MCNDAYLTRRTVIRFVAISLTISLLAGCAAHYTDTIGADQYGFFSGMWHGVVFPFALLTNIVSWLVSLVGIHWLQGIQIIGRPNTGFFYYVGFAVGLCADSAMTAGSK